MSVVSRLEGPAPAFNGGGNAAADQGCQDLLTVAANESSPDETTRPSVVRVYKDWPSQILGGVSKRSFDLVLAPIILLLLTPVLLIACMAVWLQDGGSPIYRHTRIGVGGKSFKCIKFRTMRANSDALLAQHLAEDASARAEWARTRKLTRDPRVTALGTFLRKSSIDELPQLINVIVGDMSLVGPRPVVADELDRYDLDRVHYLKARPGLTGLWQVSGRSMTSYERRVAIDKSYATRWSFLGDIGIILRTIPAVLFLRGSI